MKKITLFLFLFCAFDSIAQNPVLNQSFENWTTGDPDNWTVNNSNVPPMPLIPVTQATDAFTGNSALRGEVIDVLGNAYPPTVYSAPSGAQSGFPINQMHNSLLFYYKFFAAQPNDQIFAYVNIQNSTGSAIASGALGFGTATNIYTLGEVAITYFDVNPTNMELSFTIINTATGTPNMGSWFILDELSMSDPTAIKEIAKEGIGNVYPNPATSVINIPFYQPAKGAVTVSIYDSQGKLIRNVINEENVVGQCKLIESVSDLVNGTYQCYFHCGDVVQSTTFQVAR